MDLLVFAVIAIYFIYKLNTVLGNRDYNYDNQKFNMSDIAEEMAAQTERGEKIIDAKVELTDEEAIINKNPIIITLLKQIRSFDKSFREQSFVKSASTAFEMILAAFSKNDRNTLKILLSKNIYQEFVKHIENHEKQEITIEQSLVSLKEVDIVKGRLEGEVASLTVKFVTEQIYVVRDKNSNIIEGNPSKIINKTDLWTFTKNLLKAEPIWELIATG